MGVIAEGILRGCKGLFNPVSLGYPLSVFNKILYSQNENGLRSFRNVLSCALRRFDEHTRCTDKNMKENIVSGDSVKPEQKESH